MDDRQSNVDISRLPKFTSLDEAKAYFNRFGKLTFWGCIGYPPDEYFVYTYQRSNGLDYFIDIYKDGRVVVIQRGTDLFKNF